MQRKPPYPLIIVLLLLVIAAGVYYFYFYLPQTSVPAGKLTASGTVETTQISIAPEISGRIVEIKVQEGDTVKAGDVLFSLDDTLLKAQRAISAANLETASAGAATAKAAAAAAQSQYDITLNVSLAKDKSNRTQNWYKTQNSDFTLPQWYYNQGEQMVAAKSVVDVASLLLTRSQERLAKVQAAAGAADFIAAENELASAQANFLVAQDLYNRAWNGTNTDDLSRRQNFLLARDAWLDSKDVAAKWVTLNASVDKDMRDEAQTIYDDAKDRLKNAQTAYTDATSTDSAKDIIKARAQYSIDLENYQTALDYVRNLQTGSDSESVNAAQKVLDQANAAATQAASAVKQAQANLDYIDAQLVKTVVKSPSDGVVLTRSGEPGSVVNAGGAVLVIGRQDVLTITVYVPEDRIGEIKLGQSASVTVDSFPGETFSATVSYISDQAEFTPRNVQTVEGRKNTVFAVKLNLGDTSGKLKPGMPADVTFK